jgi:hypothetical protein
MCCTKRRAPGTGSHLLQPGRLDRPISPICGSALQNRLIVHSYLFVLQSTCHMQEVWAWMQGAGCCGWGAGVCGT